MASSATILVLLLLLGGCMAGTPLQETLVRGIHLLAQLIQVDEGSPVFPFFKALQQRFMESPKPPKGEDDEGAPTGLWGTLFRSLGLKSTQIPAMSVNLLIFLAQMVSNAFPASEKESPRGYRRGRSLLETVLDQPKVSRLVSTMQDPALMDHVLTEVEGQLSGEKSECVVQLLCRSSPVVRGMQTSLAFFLRQETSIGDKGPARGENGAEGLDFDVQGDNLAKLTSTWKKLSPMQRLFFFMPSLSEFMTAGDLCRKKYTQCSF